MNAAEQQQHPKYVHGGKLQWQIPLVSKIRRKKKAWIKNSNEDDDDEECIPLTMAIPESHSNCSLLDRIASLEDRILQLCSEIELYTKSSSSESLMMMRRDKFLGAPSSSCSGSKIERMRSYPTFNIPKTQTRRLPRVSFNDNVVFQGNTNGVQQQQQGQQIEISSLMKKQLQQLRGKKKDRKTSRNGKKNVSPSWPHLKLFGC